MTRYKHPSFTFGIEEEYFLVGGQTRALVDAPKEMLVECSALLGEHFSAEYQCSQIEVATKICASVPEARQSSRVSGAR